MVLLYDHVAAARKGGVLFAHNDSLTRSTASWIFCAIDEANDIAIIQIPKTARSAQKDRTVSRAPCSRRMQTARKSPQA